jgi:hypothetical protein
VRGPLGLKRPATLSAARQGSRRHDFTVMQRRIEKERLAVAACRSPPPHTHALQMGPIAPNLMREHSMLTHAARRRAQETERRGGARWKGSDARDVVVTARAV